jgi:hypothetical protein
MTNMNNDSTLNEVVTRMRRVETRLTAYMASQGVEFNAQPRWVTEDSGAGHIELTALTASLTVCLSVVPKDYPFDDVDVTHGGRVVAVLYLEGTGQ